MSRLEKVPFWFAVGLVWLFSLVVILGQLQLSSSLPAANASSAYL